MRAKGKPVVTKRSPRALTEADVKRLVAEAMDDHHRKLQDLAEAAATKAVQNTLTLIGIDTSNPILAQATFLSLRGLVKTFADEDFQKDLQHIRGARESMATVKSKGWSTAIGAGVTAALFLGALGFKDWITK